MQMPSAASLLHSLKLRRLRACRARAFLFSERSRVESTNGRLPRPLQFFSPKDNMDGDSPREAFSPGTPYSPSSPLRDGGAEAGSPRNDTGFDANNFAVVIRGTYRLVRLSAVSIEMRSHSLPFAMLYLSPFPNSSPASPSRAAIYARGSCARRAHDYH